MDILLKTTAVYFLIMITLRFMGKREIGQLGLFDFVVLLLVADISALALDTSNSFWYYLIPVAVLSIIQKILAIITLKIPKLRNILDGDISIIIYKGKLNLKEMKKQRYNIDDLLTQVRLKNIICLSQIEYLIMETNGEISIYLYNKHKESDSPNETLIKTSNNSIIPNSGGTSVQVMNNIDNKAIFPVIISGKINKENIKLLNVTEKWINTKVQAQNKNVKDIHYATIINNDLFIMETCEI